MPVDKFVSADYRETSLIEDASVSSVEGMNETILRRDGRNTVIGTIDMRGNALINLRNPVLDHHVATKFYVDESSDGIDKVSKTGDTVSGSLNMVGSRITGLPDSLPSSGSDAVSWLHAVGLMRGAETESDGKVSERGDVMTGDLTLSIDDDEMRVLGCSDLSPNKYFCLLLGDELNRLYFILRVPVVLQTTHGFLINAREEDVCQIGTDDHPPESVMFRNIRMNSSRIINLPSPNFPHEVATKSYVDDCPRKILNGYVPILRSLGNATNLKTGFVVTASSQAGRRFVPMNVFNGFYARGTGSGGEWAADGATSNFYLQVKCPELVRVWRVALRGRDINTQSIFSWNIQGSTDGENFSVIFTPPNPTYLGNTVQYFLIETSEKCNYYILFCLEAEERKPGLSYMQLYIYSD